MKYLMKVQCLRKVPILPWRPIFQLMKRVMMVPSRLARTMGFALISVTALEVDF